MSTVIIFTTGEPGSGKTYCRAARYLADEFLPERSGVHISNFPVNIEKMAEFVASRTGQDELELQDRIERIPPDVIESWMEGESGPWEYFADRDLDRAHIGFDECHEFISRESPKEVRVAWRRWLAQIRHQGATVEFISQNPQQVALEVTRLASRQIELHNASEEKEPIFGIRQRFWQELYAGFFTGKYTQLVRQSELGKVKGSSSKWRVEESRMIPLVPEYFDLYDSYSAPKEGAKVGRGELHEFQKRGKLSLLWWFYTRNYFPIMKRFVIVGGAFAFFFLGGMNFFIQQCMKLFTGQSGDVQVYAQDGDQAERTSYEQPEYVLPPGIEEVDAEQYVELQNRANLGCCDEAERLQQVLAQVKEEHRVAMEMLTDELQDAEGELAKVYQISLITEDEVTFRNGYSFKVGELIDAGTYKGTRVESINWRRRSVLLDDGTVIRMGGSTVKPGDDELGVGVHE